VLLAGACSSDEDVVEQPEPLPADAAYPDINTVPTERPEPIIVDIFAAPEGLKADTVNADHSGELTGGPTSSAEPPPPPPPPPEPVVDPLADPAADPAVDPMAEPAVEPDEVPADQQQSRSKPPAGEFLG
jgi:hypothetical protein